jgi:hypothetical protein
MKNFYWYFPDSKIQDEVIIKWLSALDVPVVLFSDDTDYQIEMRKYLKHPIIPNFENNTAYANDMWFLQFLQLSKCNVKFALFIKVVLQPTHKNFEFIVSPLSFKHALLFVRCVFKMYLDFNINLQ